MHCNLRPTEPRQPITALITTPCLVWSRWTYPLPNYSVLLLIVYAVTLTFDLWPWTFATYCLWRDETLYQISTQSSNRRQSYCDFNVWSYDHEHCVTCCTRSGIIFAMFDFQQRQLNSAWIIAFFDADTLCHAVTLTLTYWLSKFVVHQTSRDQSPYDFWAKSSSPRLNYE